MYIPVIYMRFRVYVFVCIRPPNDQRTPYILVYAYWKTLRREKKKGEKKKNEYKMKRYKIHVLQCARTRRKDNAKERRTVYARGHGKYKRESRKKENWKLSRTYIIKQRQRFANLVIEGRKLRTAPPRIARVAVWSNLIYGVWSESVPRGDGYAVFNSFRHF